MDVRSPIGVKEVFGASGMTFTAAVAATRRTVKIILANPDSRKIFQFLMLNLAFMGVQLLWGVWTNSLGLISDAIHMFFDCAAIGMGLFASVMATWPTDSTFTYGYGRVETLSGFANGIFLILISVFIVFEALQRIIEPPVMNNNTQLLIVSSMGLAVNLFGMWATGGHHHHHHGHSHGHDHGHGHEHEHGHGHGHSHNMMGVYLHVMADTLGSVGVIISTLLIGQFGWTGFDPIASLFIAFMIVGSVIPLVLESGRILCLDVGEHRSSEMTDALEELRSIDGVVAYHSPRFWPKDAETLVGVIRVQVAWPTLADTNDQHRDHAREHDVTHGRNGLISRPNVQTPEAIATKVENLLKARIHGLESVAVQLEKVGAGATSLGSALTSTPISASPSYSSLYEGSPAVAHSSSGTQKLSPATTHRRHH